MNTTHSISNLEAGSYTVIGNKPQPGKSGEDRGFSVIFTNTSVLNISVRRDRITQLLSIGAREIICIEKMRPQGTKFNMHSLCRSINHLRFLIFFEDSSRGAKINAAIKECTTPYQFVLGGNMEINSHGSDAGIFNEEELGKQLCTVPIFRNEMGDLLPTVFGPVILNRNRFETRSIHPGRGECDTLLPWDYTAIYNRDRHVALGGYDIAIKEPWWQKLEYGLRAWLWGEEIRTHSSLELKYVDQSIAEDHSISTGYGRLFFKTLAIRRKKNEGRFPNLLIRVLSNMNSLPVSSGQKRELRSWVRENRHRYTQDAFNLAKQWNWNEDGANK